MKVKIFDYSGLCGEKHLEENINDFINEIEKQHMEVKDIKYSTVYGRDYHYSALVMYGPDGKLYLEPMFNESFKEDMRKILEEEE